MMDVMNEPARYRKRPVTINAMQWNGTPEHATTVINWVVAAGGTARYVPRHGELRPHLVIETLEGEHRAGAAWWIAQGVKGEFYPIRPDIFEETYDRATDT